MYAGSVPIVQAAAAIGSAMVIKKYRKVIKSCLKKGAREIKERVTTAAKKGIAAAATSLARDVCASDPHGSMMAFALDKAAALPDPNVRATVARIELVGMDVKKCVCSNILPPANAQAFLRQKMVSKQIPEAVVEAIVRAMEGSTRFADADGGFCHTSDGRSHLYQYALYTQVEDGLTKVALLCANASFQTAQVMDIEEVVEPIMETYTEYTQVVEDGLLGAYRQIREQTRTRETGATRVINRPVPRPHVMSSLDMDAIRCYLETQAAVEAVRILN